MFKRSIQLPKDHSFFLFGPRGTGKTTLLKELLPTASSYRIDLLDAETELRFVQQPWEFSERLDALPASTCWVIVDEVQKIPALLDQVQQHIQKNPNRHFALTGSSARKLKHGQANLLAGRAFTLTLAPLTSQEIGKQFNFHQALAFGTLPKIYHLKSDSDKKRFLRSYVYTYIKEEVQSEGIVRQLDSFRRFLPVAAAQNGLILSWNNFAQEVGLNAKTIRSYFEILEDTLLGFLLPPYYRSLRKRQRTHPKFYFFDTGIKRALANELNIPLVPGTSEYGRTFEHWWIVELMRQAAYREMDYTFSYFATYDTEIDLVVERPNAPLLFIEIKSKQHITDRDLRSLRSVVQSVSGSAGICLCQEAVKRKIGKILICPWQNVVEEVFS